MNFHKENAFKVRPKTKRWSQKDAPQICPLHKRVLPKNECANEVPNLSIYTESHLNSWGRPNSNLWVRPNFFQGYIMYKIRTWYPDKIYNNDSLINPPCPSMVLHIFSWSMVLYLIIEQLYSTKKFYHERILSAVAITSIKLTGRWMKGIDYSFWNRKEGSSYS